MGLTDMPPPLGVDFIARSVRATMQYKNLDFWYENFEGLRGWTGETRVIGLRIVFTADPENIKARASHSTTSGRSSSATASSPPTARRGTTAASSSARSLCATA
jgi:hypothetical protein